MDDYPYRSPRAQASRINGRLGGRPRAAWAILETENPRAVLFSADDRAAIETWLHTRAATLKSTRKFYVRNPDGSIAVVRLACAAF